MAGEDENGQEKTEDPSGRKLDKSRDEGQVPKSRDLPAAMTMAAFVLFAYVLGQSLFMQAGTMFKYSFSHLITGDITIIAIMALVKSMVGDILPTLLMLLAILVVAGVVGNLAVTGWVVSSKAVSMDFTKLNPLPKIKSIFFSLNSIVELLKSSLKMLLFILLCVVVIWDHFAVISAMNKLTTMGSAVLLGRILLEMLRNCLIFYVILGVADWAYQKWKYHEDMKMTKQEAKEEYKNTEGDPKIKAQLRRKRIELLKTKAKQAVQGADVVITNPTHYAVALKYDEEKMHAPVLVAKGSDFMAQQIKKIAREAGVSVIESPPLARFLYGTVKIGHEIPEEAYKAVAEILVRVYKTKGKQSPGK